MSEKIASITRIKKDVFRVLKTVLPEGFLFHDSEEFIDEKKTPLVCVSSDSGTDFNESSYSVLIGKTDIKLDVYIALGKTFKSILETDFLQEKIIKALLKDEEIEKKYKKISVKKIGALTLLGESKLRVLTHDLEIEWTLNE